MTAPVSYAANDAPAFSGTIASWPVIGIEEEALLLEAYRSGEWWYGRRVQQFERDYAAYHHAKHGITCVNGTVALELVYKALGIGPGDEVIVPSYTFIATAGAVVQLNAIPRFADVDHVTANIDFESAARLVNEHTKAIAVVHFAGLPVDMDRARAFAAEHKIALVEDAAHSWGSQWDGQGVGSLGDAGTFSFQVTKNMAAGEGGIVITNRSDVASSVRSYTNCGRLEEGKWYEHFLLGGNYRMTELQAALLIPQLERLEEHTRIRQENASFLEQELAKIPGLTIPKPLPKVTRRSYHLFVIQYDATEFGGMHRDEFVKALEAERLPASVGYLTPVYGNVCFQTLHTKTRPENAWLAKTCADRGIYYDQVSCPNAEKLCSETMVWLPHTLLLGSRQDMEQVVAAFNKVHAAACAR